MRLEKNIKALQQHMKNIEPLIEGLPFSGPVELDQSPLHYFSKAASLHNGTEAFFASLNEHLEERCKEFEKLVNQVAEWDLDNEGLNDNDKAIFRRLQKRYDKRVKGAIKRMVGVGQKQKSLTTKKSTVLIDTKRSIP